MAKQKFQKTNFQIRHLAIPTFDKNQYKTKIVKTG